MTPLIDADLLLYECGYAGEYVDEETGEKIPRDFEDVKEVVDHRIGEICAGVWATEDPLLFLTGDERLLKDVNRERVRLGENLLQWEPNFRFARATTTPYKQRKSDKPYHYYNIRAYLRSRYEVLVAWGMEADDCLSIYQVSRLSSEDTVICSRDKDERQVEGFFYSWECGNQPEFGPVWIDKLGYLEMPKPGKLFGTGFKFFCAQLIMGDPVDTIPGLPRGGPALAYKTLRDCETEEDCLRSVKELYVNKFGEGWRDMLLEQGTLLYMIRELDEDGKPVMWEIPNYLED